VEELKKKVSLLEGMNRNLKANLTKEYDESRHKIQQLTESIAAERIKLQNDNLYLESRIEEVLTKQSQKPIMLPMSTQTIAVADKSAKEVELLKQELHILREETRNYEVELESCRAENSRFRETSQRADLNIQRINAESEKLRRELMTANSQLSRDKLRTEELVKDIQSLTEECLQKQESIDRERLAAEDWERKVKILQEENRILQTGELKVKTLETELSKVRREKLEREDEVSRLKKIEGSLQVEVNKLTKQNEALMAVSQKGETMSTQIEENLKQKVKIEGELLKVSQEHELVKREVQRLLTENQKLVGLIEEGEAKTRDLESDRDRLGEKTKLAEVVQKQLTDVLTKNEKYLSEIHSLQGTIHTKDKTIRNLETKFTNWKLTVQERVLPTLISKFDSFIVSTERKIQLLAARLPQAKLHSLHAAITLLITNYQNKVSKQPPLVAGGLDYAAFFDLQKENKDLKAIIAKLEHVGGGQPKSNESGQGLDQLKLDNENLREQLRAFVAQMIDANGEITRLNEDLDKVKGTLSKTEKSVDPQKQKEKTKLIREGALRLVQQSESILNQLEGRLGGEVNQSSRVDSDLDAAKWNNQVEQAIGKKLVVEARLEARRLKSIIGILERDVMKLNSKIDDLHRQNKRGKEERAIFIEANERLVAANKEKDEEIKHLRLNIDSFSNPCLIRGKGKQGEVDSRNEEALRSLRKEVELLRAQNITLKKESNTVLQEKQTLTSSLQSELKKKECLLDFISRLLDRIDPAIARKIIESLKKIDFKPDFQDEYHALVEQLESKRVDELLRDKKEGLQAKVRMLKAENEKVIQALQSQRLAQDMLGQKLINSQREAKGLPFHSLIICLAEEIERE